MARHVAYAHIQGRDVPMTVADEVAGDPCDIISDVQGFPPFEAWVHRMSAVVEYMVKEVKVQFVEKYRSVDGVGERLGVCKIHTKAVNEEGVTIPSSFVLKGPSAACLLCFDCGGTNHVVVGSQVRPAVGTVVHELPSGLLDLSGNFCGMAADALTTLLPKVVLSAKYLKNLTHAVRPSDPHLHTVPRGNDETVRVMLYRKRVSPEELGTIVDTLTDNASANNFLNFELLSVDDIPRAKYADARLLAACYLLKKSVAAAGADGLYTTM